ncbi:hypothetical protein [Nocardioides aurantiacus]|nr:hypothetical protein [Nocardioides aurantiacus]
MSSTSWDKTASLYDGPRAVGGRLHVTPDQRLQFRPHGFDRALGGRTLDIGLDTTTRLSRTKRTWFAPRRHVLVETADGTRARPLVNGAADLIERLAGAARTAGANPDVDNH